MTMIKNEELTLEMLPAVDDSAAIYQFALSLECTGGYDSFQEAQDNVEGKAKSMTDIRMELYFAAKAYDAIKIEEHVEVYQDCFEHLATKIKSGDFK